MWFEAILEKLSSLIIFGVCSLQVDDIEVKLDQLIELYTEDRKRFWALRIPEPDYQHVTPTVNVQGTPMSSTSLNVTVLKPILVDKQLSEPSSPTTGSFREAEKRKPRQMHRGHSDLGSRVKKRVTLRFVI